MASTIDDTSIDATFPVAGQDNNSQGFRDNFNTVKSNFVAAKSEITTLQTNSAKLNANNNFSGNEISGALFKTNFTKTHDMGSVTTDQNISVANGNFQTIIVGSNVTLNAIDFFPLSIFSPWYTSKIFTLLIKSLSIFSTKLIISPELYFSLITKAKSLVTFW